MIFRWFKKKWHERIIRHSSFKAEDWEEAFHHLPLLQRLSDGEVEALKHLAILFLYYKSIEPVGDLDINPIMQLIIALQACLPILYLGLEWYQGWVSVIIYPAAFSKEGLELDEFGIEHQGREHLSGESWQRGPVILSWDDCLGLNKTEGSNVVLHEFAHKLDMLNGAANGFPPLHQNMSITHWTEVFTRAFEDLNSKLEHQVPVPITPYAATSPAEFFAVFTELFFETPALVKQAYPEVYEALVNFYRQNPLKIQ